MNICKMGVDLMKLSIAVRLILSALEIFLLMIFVIPLSRNVVNAGNIFGIVLCLILLAATVMWEKFFSLIRSSWNARAGRIVICSAVLLISIAVIYAVYLSILMAGAYNAPPKEPNAVVVLGCSVKGTRPSQMLAYRLDAAYDYLNEHEDVICIVSGGQGRGEDISEAEAMKTYLVEKGIDPERIFEEGRSSSTKENLLYSAEILEDMGLPLDITIVTDGYHQYRASLLAKDCGYDSVYSISGYTKPYLLPTFWLREWLALTAYYIFD